MFDGKVKLIRNESIGEYSWDNKNVSTGAENDYCKNDWTDARLMKLLNPGYESKLLEVAYIIMQKVVTAIQDRVTQLKHVILLAQE